MDWVALIGAVGTLLSVVLLPFAIKWRAEAVKTRQDRDEAERKAYMAGHEEARALLAEVNTDLRAQVGRQDGFISTLQRDATRCHQDFAELRAAHHYLRLAVQRAGIEVGPEPEFSGEHATFPPDFAAKQKAQDHTTLNEITEKIDEKQRQVKDGGKP